jgi:zinc protease
MIPAPCARLTAALCLSAALAAPVAAQQVSEQTLPNGLHIIVKEDHRAPVVVSQVWYKVGSSYELAGTTGISHVLEHMMFKGTKAHPAGEFSRIIAENGGRENAFTAQDYTAYFQQLEASRLPVSFELEADRMRHLQLPAAEFKKELQVVMEERRLRTEDQPQAYAVEQFNAAAWTHNPYHNPIIGWMTDLDSLTVDDLRAWYARWYAPNNATLVVVGDVEPKTVFKLANKYFGPLKPSTIVPQKPRLEPVQKGEKRITVRVPAELPFVMLGYKVPSLKTADQEWKAYALEVLSGILDGGNSARLSRELVRGTQVAAGAGAGYDLYNLRGDLFGLSGTPAPGHTIAELEIALRKQVARLRAEPVAQDELERIKAQVTASKVYEKDSVFYQAMQIGSLESVGLDWRLADQYVSRIAAVTPEQVQQVAREFLNDDALTVAVLEPLPLGDKKPAPEMGGAANAIR